MHRETIATVNNVAQVNFKAMKKGTKKLTRTLSPHIDVRKRHNKEAKKALDIATQQEVEEFLQQTPREKKNVSFNHALNETVYTDKFGKIAKSVEATWFTSKDFKAMRKQEAKLTKELAKSFPGRKFSLDGVESMEYRRLKIERVQKSRDCVMKLQKLPGDSFAAMYGKTSSFSVKLAREKGLYNELEAKRVYSGEQTTNLEDTVETSTRSDRSDSSEESLENSRSALLE